MANPNGTLIVHVGCPKTGTSGIQSALYHLHEELAERSVSYPNLTGQGFGWQAERGVMSGNGEVTLSGYKAGTLGAEWQHLLNRCGEVPSAEVQIVSSETLVSLVGEEFFWRDLAGHAAAAGKGAVVVVYLRDPFPFFLSTYSQAVKTGGYVGTLEDWVDVFWHYGNWYLPYRQLDQMYELARRYGCQLKAFRFEDARGQIGEHFLGTACGVSTQGLTIPNKLVNQSLTAFDCSFHRGINSRSAHLGSLLTWDRTDTKMEESHLSSGEPGRFELSREGRAKLDRIFGDYRSVLARCTEFADRVDYSIRERRLTECYTAEEAGIHLKFYELGRILASSYVAGYIRWDLDRHQTVPGA